MARLPTSDAEDRASLEEVQVEPASVQLSGQSPAVGGWKNVLLKAGLRPRQRLMLSELLFARGARHVSAEMLFAEARETGFPVPWSTVYNTLNKFTQAGLLRRFCLDGSRALYDTNTTPHPHYYLHGEDTLLDVPNADLLLVNVPEPLRGHEVSCGDLIIHLRRKRS
ncbi:Fur family transcriptional regulator [Bradyrhizobium sp. CCBAU 051011]|uniref:Fur family transcriptional regulator n=1 Tax=Bradyrhizobium sp. CCBAU 051011 TaxID=858422 RepID=UPI001FEDD9A2|nr:transcriptional repressor [Bradyrhizobium sp. CCBAU 051011]